MAVRTPLVFLMALLTLTATPISTYQISPALMGPSSIRLAGSDSLDPAVRNIAFNVTLAQFDLYTNGTMALQPDPVMSPSILIWFGSSIDGRQVNGTRFVFEIPSSPGVIVDQNVTWSLTIAKGNYTAPGSTTTFVRFRWNGTVASGTTAQYTLLDGTTVVNRVVHNETFTTGQSLSSLPCLPDEECFDVSGFTDKTLSLVFRFNSTSAGTGLKVEVSHVAVASVSRQLTNPLTDMHTMNVDTDPEKIIHAANSTIVPYNTTAAQPQTGVHVWNSTAAIFRFPQAYTLTEIKLNGTSALNLLQTLDEGVCTASCNNRLPIGNTTISNTRFISFNLTSISGYDALTRSIPAVISALSPRTVITVETALGGLPTDSWVPGDLVGVRMRVRPPSFNVTGSHIVTFTDPNILTLPNLNQTFNNRGGVHLYNFTLPTTATLGQWTVKGTFLSSYDFGLNTTTIRVDQINTSPPTLTGGAGQGRTLTIQGALTYKSDSSPAGNVNVTVFAVDAGSPPAGGLVSTPASTLSSGLYISDITIVNGVFTQNQALIVFFTVANPLPSTAFNANITVEHEWYDGIGGSHGVNATFPLELGDQPFLSPSFLYRMDASLTSGDLQLTITSVATKQGVTLITSAGTSRVSSSRQHFGSFRIAVTSAQIPAGSPSTSLPLLSPTYAYILDTSLIPSRLVGFSSTVATRTDGSFSTTINADKLLGAKRLVVFAIARDANGIVTGRDQVKTVSESTVLTPTANIPTEVTIRQTVTVTLNLKSNSTGLPITLTVNLGLSGSGTLRTKTVTIQPGATAPTTFNFTAPDAAGSYLLTFSSPQYGVLLADTLQVALLQSSLQVLIPAIIGLVAALVILGLYLIRKRPETEMAEEEKKRAPGKPSKPTQGSSSSKSLTRS